jgi:hypothetical protein
MKLTLMTALTVALFLTGCGKQKKDQTMGGFRARQIHLQQLRSVLNDLAQGKLEFDFFGITSNGVDCIYFVPVNGKLDLEFEAMSEEQIPFIGKLKAYAAGKGFSVVDTTYGNKPQYESSASAPVLRIEIRATLDEAASIGGGVMKDIFGCTDSTMFEVVP